MSNTMEIPLDRLAELESKLPAPGTVDVTIEVLDEELGDQVEVQSLPWHSFIFDAENEIIELAVGGRGKPVPVVLRHEIHDPDHVWIEEGAAGIKALSIHRKDGPQTLVSFRERPALRSG